MGEKKSSGKTACGLGVHKDSVFLPYNGTDGRKIQHKFGVLTGKLATLHDLMSSDGVEGSGEPARYYRHSMKYDKHGRPNRTAKAGNISGRTGIHDRPEEADSGRSGNQKADTTTNKNGKGVILTLTERSSDFILMEIIKAAHAAKIAIRLLLPYRGDGVKTMTTDIGRWALRARENHGSDEGNRRLFRRSLLFVAGR